MSKLLLTLQFWEGDKAQAMEVARLIADLEPAHNPDVDFLFSTRFDSSQDLSTIEYVSKKFKVFHHLNKNRRGVGWPSGCNDLFFGSMDFIYSWTEALFMPEYDAILTFESDACPLAPYWHKSLMKAWHEANAKKRVNIFGAMVKYPKPHINGNALFSGKLPFLHEVSRKIGGCPPTVGWDFYLARDFARMGWANCEQMRSFWGQKTMQDGEIDALIASQVAFLHGVKDRSVMNYIRKRFVR